MAGSRGGLSGGEGKSPPWGLSWLLASIASLLLTACGIEEYVYLAPPASALSTGSSIGFYHNPENDSSSVFLGYDIYYRLYKDISQSIQPIAGVDDSSGTSPDVAIRRLETLGYKAMIGIGSDGSLINFPLFKKIYWPAGNVPSFQMNLNAEGTVSIQPNALGSFAFSIRRDDIDSATSLYKTFADFSPGLFDQQNKADTDYNDPNLSSAYFRGYVVAYGFSVSTSRFGNYYSTPMLIRSTAGDPYILLQSQ
jgi:hypothetical protein